MIPKEVLVNAALNKLRQFAKALIPQDLRPAKLNELSAAVAASWYGLTIIIKVSLGRGIKVGGKLRSASLEKWWLLIEALLRSCLGAATRVKAVALECLKHIIELLSLPLVNVYLIELSGHKVVLHETFEFVVDYLIVVQLDLRLRVVWVVDWSIELLVVALVPLTLDI